MKSRLAAAAVAAGILAAPASAGAATLEAKVAKPCYGTGDSLTLVGEGYTPGSPVRVGRRGGEPLRAPITPDAQGHFAIRLQLATIPAGTTRTQFTATDTSDPAITARTAFFRVNATTIRFRPARATPTTPRRIRAQGFTTGRTLYIHVVRGGRSRDVRVGRLRGACNGLTASRRFFRRRDFRFGQYRLQFDTFRRYRASRPQKVVFPLSVRRGA